MFRWWLAPVFALGGALLCGTGCRARGALWMCVVVRTVVGLGIFGALSFLTANMPVAWPAVLSDQAQRIIAEEDMARVFRTWLTPKHAAALVGVSPARVIALIHRGEMRALRTPHGHLIDPESTTTYADARDRRIATAKRARRGHRAL